MAPECLMNAAYTEKCDGECHVMMTSCWHYVSVFIRCGDVRIIQSTGFISRHVCSTNKISSKKYNAIESISLFLRLCQTCAKGASKTQKNMSFGFAAKRIIQIYNSIHLLLGENAASQTFFRGCSRASERTDRKLLANWSESQASVYTLMIISSWHHHDPNGQNVSISYCHRDDISDNTQTRLWRNCKDFNENIIHTASPENIETLAKSAKESL